MKRGSILSYLQEEKEKEGETILAIEVLEIIKRSMREKWEKYHYSMG